MKWNTAQQVDLIKAIKRADGKVDVDGIARMLPFGANGRQVQQQIARLRKAGLELPAVKRRSSPTGPRLDVEALQAALDG